MSLKLTKYLVELRKEANRLKRTDINNKVDDTFYAKYFKMIIFLIICGISIIILNKGYNKEFLGYISSILSILVGLFITALIFSFDKFYDPIQEENPNSRTKLWDKQDYNYSKKFSYITAYTIVLSIFTLVMLVPNILFESFINLDLNSLTLQTKEISANSIKLFLKAFLIIIQRFIIAYWLLEILYNTLFIVSSMVQYMSTKIDRK